MSIHRVYGALTRRRKGMLVGVAVLTAVIVSLVLHDVWCRPSMPETLLGDLRAATRVELAERASGDTVTRTRSCTGSQVADALAGELLCRLGARDKVRIGRRTFRVPGDRMPLSSGYVDVRSARGASAGCAEGAPSGALIRLAMGLPCIAKSHLVHIYGTISSRKVIFNRVERRSNWCLGHILGPKRPAIGRKMRFFSCFRVSATYNKVVMACVGQSGARVARPSQPGPATAKPRTVGCEVATRALARERSKRDGYRPGIGLRANGAPPGGDAW